MLAVIFIRKIVRRRTRKEMCIVGRRKKYPKLPNGFGSIKRLSGKNRTNPYGVYPPTTEFDSDGNPVPVKALCYVDDWYKGFTVLTWYKHGEYYPGREKELTEAGNSSLNGMIEKILSKYSQSKREIADQKTFADVFLEYYENKFGQPYNHPGKKRPMERSVCAAYKNSSVLHNESFRNLTANTLQSVVDDCPLKHASLELIVTLFHQMYAYADANDLCDKDYSKYVTINIDDDDEHGVPFTDEELVMLWENQNDPTIELILIMCYSGFRISEYLSLEVNTTDWSFFGGLKTDAGKNRIVPIHTLIRPIVIRRLNREKTLLPVTTQKFRVRMYDVLESLGIEKHTPHDCRHTFNSLCDRFSVVERDKKLMLGHAFSDVTNKVYLHRTLEDLRGEIEKIKLCR